MSEIDDLIEIILNYQPTKKDLLLFIKLHNEDHNIKNYSDLSIIDLHKLVLNYINKFYKIVKIKKIKKSKKLEESKIKAYEDLKKIYEESQKYTPINIRKPAPEALQALKGLKKLQDKKNKSNKSKIKAYEDLKKIYEESQKYTPLNIRKPAPEALQALEGLKKLQDEKNKSKLKDKSKQKPKSQPKPEPIEQYEMNNYDLSKYENELIDNNLISSYKKYNTYNINLDKSIQDKNNLIERIKADLRKRSISKEEKERLKKKIDTINETIKELLKDKEIRRLDFISETPFNKLTKEERNILVSDEFYNKKIKMYNDKNDRAIKEAENMASKLYKEYTDRMGERNSYIDELNNIKRDLSKNEYSQDDIKIKKNIINELKDKIEEIDEIKLESQTYLTSINNLKDDIRKIEEENKILREFNGMGKRYRYYN